MTPATSTLAAMAGHLSSALAPLQEMTSDLSQFQSWMSELGWSVTSLPSSYAALGASAGEVIAAADALSDDPEPTDVIAVIVKVSDVYRALRALDEAPGGVDEATFLRDIGELLFELLLTSYLRDELPALYQTLRAAGVLRREDVASTSKRPGYTRAHLDYAKIPVLLADPVGTIQETYGFGADAFDFVAVTDDLLNLCAALGVYVSTSTIDPALQEGYQTGAGPALEALLMSGARGGVPVRAGLALLELSATGGKPPGFVLQPQISADIGASVTITPDLVFSLRGGTDVSSTMGVLIRPDEVTVKYPLDTAASLPSTGFGASLIYAPSDATLLLGRSSATRIEVQGATFGLSVDGSGADTEVAIDVETSGLSLVIAASESDSFLQSLLGDSEITSSFDTTLRWSSKTGLAFEAGALFDLTIPLDLSIGPVHVDAVHVEIGGETSPPSAFVSAGVTFGASLGPFSFSVEDIGLRFDLLFQEGNAGPFDVGCSFKPPTGLGISIDAEGVVTGGGYLAHDEDEGSYAGAAEIGFAGVSLTAIGVLATKMPDGSAGWSMFLSLAAQFTGVQLGFGFTLNGVGGLIGVNRGLDDDALAEGVRSGAVDHLLFPDDPIAEAPVILAEIDDIFPKVQGQYVFGPVALIGWGTPTLIELSVGVILQLPDPFTISLLGSLEAILPTQDAPIVELRVDVAGTLDFTEGTLKIDASLRDSRVLSLELTGDMAVRASFLDNPTFLLAFGGFHPDFTPPDDFPSLKRLGVSLSTGDNLRISLQGYFALTSNTVQIGAEFSLWASAMGFTLEGGASFDALVTFKPFGFDVGVRVWVSVRAIGVDLLGVELKGDLSGPNPWKIAGTATFKVLGIKKSVDVRATIGAAKDEPPSEVVDVAQLLLDEIDREDAWSALPPEGDGFGVVLAEGAETSLAAHPAGRIQVKQRVAPLDVALDHYGSASISGTTTFSMTSPKMGTLAVEEGDTEPVSEYFAAAHYFDMTEEEKLSAPSFESFPAGIVMGDDGLSAGGAETDTFTYDHEVVYRDPNVRAPEREKTGKVVAATLVSLDRALTQSPALAARTKAKLPRSTKKTSPYAVAATTYVVTDASTGDATSATPKGYFAARDAWSEGRVIIPSYELELIA